MFYSFVCASGHQREYIESLKFGPPKNVTCDCSLPMYQEFGGNFILKGDGWPGKSIKLSDEARKAQEMTERRDDAIKSGKQEAAEVLAERRKGSAAFKEFINKNPKKVERVRKNRTKGIK